MKTKTLNHILGLWALVGCNGHPLAPLDEHLVVTRRQVFQLADRPAVDFLFVVDASGSMAQEQALLARNMADFADYFVGRQAAFDFRIAVTTPDLTAEAGAFATAAAPYPVAGQPPPLVDLTECGELEAAGLLGPVLAPDALEAACEGAPDAGECLRIELGRRFKCLAVRGSSGSGFERGLEATRRALSCAGPNQALFAACCDGADYDPACQPSEPPAFLRPDAKLVVVIVSDEDDCSEVPGSTISQEDQRDCLWKRDQLMPVSEYVRFLQSLKARPHEQLLVATVVGPALLTEAGTPITYVPGEGPPGCNRNQADYDSRLTIDDCCPDGVCSGSAWPVCPGTGASAGTRYLELADALGGLGCPAGAEGSEACLSVCADDFAAPVRRILDAARRQRFCLDLRPDCTLEAACDALRVSLSEGDQAATHGGTRRVLSPHEVVLDLAAGDCGSGAAVALTQAPPPGASIIVDYRVESP